MSRECHKLLKESHQISFKLCHRKPYIALMRDYTLNDSQLFNQLYQHHIKLGETAKKARLIAKGEECRLRSLSKAKKVMVKYKQGKEIIGKIFKLTHQHIALKLNPKHKPIWLDRRYIRLIKIV
ncbi:hypothetical protein [Cysteiniphilum halobium]|uniref:hypothetical protein n=1 Tax=Cysteiniphilum halobium TaxID=2219059 RepID=UPI000E645DDC|nr:hypothetical protein [Cysteiniphilum halobium]